MATDKQSSYLVALVQIASAEAKKLGFEADNFRNDEGKIDQWKIQNDMRVGDASKLISGLTEGYLRKHWTWKTTSKQTVVAEFMWQYATSRGQSHVGRHDYDRVLRYVRNTLGLKLQGDFAPLVFTRNENGSRIPVDMVTAEEQFLKGCSAVKNWVNQRLAKQEDGEQQNEQQQEDLLDEIENDSGEIEIEQEQEDEQEDSGSGRIEIDEDFPPLAQDLLRRIKNICNFAADRNVGGDGVTMDAIGVRSFEDSAKLFVRKVPNDLIVSNIVQHWQPEAVRTIWEYPGEYVSQHQDEKNPWDIDPMEFRPVIDVPGLAFVNESHHRSLKLLLTYMDARLPTLCWGGSGTGKTTAYRHAAECLRQAQGYQIGDEDKFPFGFLSMTRGTAPSAFNGRPMINNTAIMVQFMMAQAEQDMAKMQALAKRAEDEGDVVMSIWQKIYTGGGVMLLDEIDAGDENLILLVNAAIANGHFANTATGELVEKHPDFIIGFAGNTNGMGANTLHGARNRLDHSTLDRVRLGRISFSLDIKLAEKVFKDIVKAGR